MLPRAGTPGDFNALPSQICRTCRHVLRWADGETLECRLTLPPWLPAPDRLNRAVEPGSWCSFWSARATGTAG